MEMANEARAEVILLDFLARRYGKDTWKMHEASMESSCIWSGQALCVSACGRTKGGRPAPHESCAPFRSKTLLSPAHIDVSLSRADISLPFDLRDVSHSASAQARTWRAFQAKTPPPLMEKSGWSFRKNDPKRNSESVVANRFKDVEG